MRVTIRPVAIVLALGGMLATPAQKIADAHTSADFLTIVLNWLLMLMLAGSVSLSWNGGDA